MAHQNSLASAAPLTAPPPADKGALAVNGKFLLEMILADLHWSSLQVATLCMMAAGSAAAGAQYSLRSCRHLAYDDSRVMRLALRYSEEVGLGADLGQRLDRLYGELGAMQKLILPFVEPVKLSSAQREQLHRLLPAMRKIALAAVDVLTRVDPMTRARLHANYAEDAVTIRQFLARAAKGELGEIDRFGVLTTPAIKQRRHSPRAPTNIACRLAHAQGESEAAITDVSRQGLGLTCQTALHEKQEIAVLVGERRLEGTVARTQGRQIGLTLRKSLAFTDPLFQAG